MLNNSMGYSFEKIGFAELKSIWADKRIPLEWSHPFMLPGWLEAWWREFGADWEPLILVAKQAGGIDAVIPLKRRNGRVSFIGDASVCDYADIVTTQDSSPYLINDLTGWLKNGGDDELILETLRPDAFAYRNCRNADVPLQCKSIDVSYQLVLERDWSTYMSSLDGKQRRDIERKERRLNELGTVHFSVLADRLITPAELGLFFNMMAQSRRDKAGFLTESIQRFFRGIVHALADYGTVRLGFLELGRVKVAGVLFFEYGDTVYLYNSGYDPDYAGFNVGLISKLYALRYAIASGKRLFDFLKGDEPYKTRLGASRLDLFSCRWDLTS